MHRTLSPLVSNVLMELVIPSQQYMDGIWSTSLPVRAVLANPLWPSGEYKNSTCQISCRSAYNCGHA